MIYAPNDLGISQLWNVYPHPVLGEAPAYQPQGFWDSSTRGPVPLRIEAAPNKAQIFLPPSRILAWHFAKMVRVVANVSFRGFSDSIDRTYPLRIRRDDPADYALSEDTARARLAAYSADFVSIRNDPESGEPLDSDLISDGGTEGDFGEAGYFNWGFEINLAAFRWTLFEADDSRPPFWGLELPGAADSFINMQAASVEIDPESEDPEDPDLITYGSGIGSEDFEVPSDPEEELVFDADMVLMGMQIPHLAPSEGSFSIAVTIDEYVPF